MWRWLRPQDHAWPSTVPRVTCKVLLIFLVENHIVYLRRLHIWNLMLRNQIISWSRFQYDNYTPNKCSKYLWPRLTPLVLHNKSLWYVAHGHFISRPTSVSKEDGILEPNSCRHFHNLTIKTLPYKWSPTIAPQFKRLELICSQTTGAYL